MLAQRDIIKDQHLHSKTYLELSLADFRERQERAAKGGREAHQLAHTQRLLEYRHAQERL